MPPKRLLTLLLLGSLLALLAFAQAPPPGPSPNAGFDLQFNLRTVEGGNAAVDHPYTLWVRTGGEASVETGRRVPISNGDGKFTYQPVGLSLGVNVLRQGAGPGQLALNCRVQLSSLVAGTPPSTPSIDTVSANSDASVPLGQRVTLARFQTLASGRTYELSLLAEPAPLPPAH